MLRAGKHVNMAVERLVVGDVVDVKFGDRIPADIRIIASAGFKVHAQVSDIHLRVAFSAQYNV